jgi:hypothetical protein
MDSTDTPGSAAALLLLDRAWGHSTFFIPLGRELGSKPHHTSTGWLEAIQ